MKVRKGVFGAVLLLCATLCMTNVTALADDGTHTHPICGTTHTDIGDHTGECADVVWTAWDGTSDIDYGDDNTAYVYLLSLIHISFFTSTPYYTFRGTMRQDTTKTSGKILEISITATFKNTPLT